jgi:hypothetical protein
VIVGHRCVLADVAGGGQPTWWCGGRGWPAGRRKSAGWAGADRLWRVLIADAAAESAAPLQRAVVAAVTAQYGVGRRRLRVAAGTGNAHVIPRL